jgi:DNA mismatch endonuclease (patch repair protein)
LDNVSQSRRSEIMARVRSKDTKPEMLVRRLVFALGYRYRLHVSMLPGTPDLVFSSRKKVLFVHGCFWHAHPGCRNHRLPKSNLEFWIPKINNNRARDVRNVAKLRRLGWGVQVIWECQVRDLPRIANRITRFLGRES